MSKSPWLLFCAVLIVLPAFSDEGFWLFNDFPQEAVQSKYGFSPSPEWLDHVRLSSARLHDGSSSFVSGNGLIFTSHHVAQSCIQTISTSERDTGKTASMLPHKRRS